jgi:hypothetical protein
MRVMSDAFIESLRHRVIENRMPPAGNAAKGAAPAPVRRDPR